MLIALWIINILLALVFIAAGVMKLRTPKEALIKPGVAWAGGFSAWQIKAIGALELVGAIGLIAPLATGIAPILAPIAAAGLAIVMAGATVTHIRLKERPNTLVLMTVSIASAVIGFFVLG